MRAAQSNINLPKPIVLPPPRESHKHLIAIIMDEKVYDQAWLQAAMENFDTCVERADYAGCLAVIEDVRSAGFVQESRTLRELLRMVPITRFAIKSPLCL